MAVFYEMWHVAVPEVPKLDDEAKDRIAAPLYAYLEETNLLAKVAKPLYQLILYNGLEIVPRIKITKDAAKAKKEKKNGAAYDDSGKKAPGQDDLGKVSDTYGQDQ